MAKGELVVAAESERVAWYASHYMNGVEQIFGCKEERVRAL